MPSSPDRARCRVPCPNALPGEVASLVHVPPCGLPTPLLHRPPRPTPLTAPFPFLYGQEPHGSFFWGWLPDSDQMTFFRWEPLCSLRTMMGSQNDRRKPMEHLLSPSRSSRLPSFIQDPWPSLLPVLSFRGPIHPSFHVFAFPWVDPSAFPTLRSPSHPSRQLHATSSTKPFQTNQTGERSPSPELQASWCLRR